MARERLDHVAIVGGGFSGALLAINLLRHDGPRAILIERNAAAGEGLAFGAAHPDHLLNVRAGNMGAFPDDPGHFVRWLAAGGMTADAGQFVPRLLYGRYLRELLTHARAAAPERLAIVEGSVRAIAIADGTQLTLDGGDRIDADAAVLAIGNLPPHAPPRLDPVRMPRDLYAPDPWAPDIAEGLGPDDTVLIVGSGLTMVDVALALDARGFSGKIVALSRRGLLPHRHDAAPAAEPLRERPPTRVSTLLATMRENAAAIGWRSAVDRLRPVTQMLWQAASADERARFLRHLRPWWDIHRHRLAPKVAERVRTLQDDGRLVIHAGRTLDFIPRGDHACLTWRPRGADREETMDVRRVINCSGPQADLARIEDPLLGALRDDGLIRPDPLRIGIDVDPQARAIGVDGQANDRLFAIGPMTRGAFWEIVAVPDIRVQSWTLARRLANAQWIGGEGL